MYKITVPMVVRNIERAGGKQKILEQLKRLDAKRVILALGAMSVNTDEKEHEIALLKEYTDFFKANGLAVSSWSWTFMTDTAHPFTAIESANGVRLNNFACPLDDEFCEFACKYIQDIARQGVDVVMLDDDFRFGYMGGKFNCTCKYHMKKITDIIGEDISARELQKRALTGGKNKYRDAWLKVNGEALIGYAKKLRAAVDEINPNIRIGFCSCISVWDADGVDSVTLAKTLAGNTKPYMRLIGAPYWAVKKSWGNRLQNVIETERMERAWCGDGIEIYAEGDAFPRPRTNCPASYLELFDIAIRASGGFDGIQKYALDYCSTTEYEKGYADRHQKNKPIYDFVDRHFDKPAVGVRVYEKMQKLSEMDIPDKLCDNPDVFNLVFSNASRMLADNSVPTTYEGEGVCGIAFGDNVKCVPRDAYKKGLILDIRAAKILMQSGVDVGIKEIGEQLLVNEEHYSGEYIYFSKPVYANEVVCDGKAIVKSEFAKTKTKFSYKKLPALIEYTNAQGERFLIYTFDSYLSDECVMRAYIRTKQVNEFAALPVFVCGCPDLYLLAKGDDSELAVGFFNIFADEAVLPSVALDREYTSVECINCTAELCGKTLKISDIPAFSFAAVILK